MPSASVTVKFTSKLTLFSEAANGEVIVIFSITGGEFVVINTVTFVSPEVALPVNQSKNPADASGTNNKTA